MKKKWYFNRITRFDNVLHIPLNWKIDREKAAATVGIPTFACSMGLSMPVKFGLFRISATFAAVTDMVLDEQKYDYEPIHDTIGFNRQLLSTDWFHRTTIVAAQELSFQLDIHQSVITFNYNDTLILFVAIEFGKLDAFGNPKPGKGGGAEKVLGVG